MANCHQQFIDFDSKISLSKSRRQSLARSRDALRERIKKGFEERDISQPRFHGQGSYMMYTIITPVDEDYDIDDGLYFLGSEPQVSIDTLHRWVVEAVEDHTDENPTDKNVCVRVNFQAGYHVDLPIYYKEENRKPFLGHKGDGWIQSDPKEFIEWFQDQIDEKGQLRRVVKYLKAWKDYRSSHLMPSGLALTILAANNFISDDRDDKAFLATTSNIHSALDSNFVCIRPTTPRGENIFSGFSQTKRDYFMERLSSLIASGLEAIEHTGIATACSKWQSHFDDRFSCPSEDEMKEARTYEEAAFIRSDARSA